MKKLLVLLALAFVLVITFVPIIAYAMAPEDGGKDTAVEEVYGPQLATDTTEATTTEPATPYTWEYLATLAGATAATLLIVQFAKVPLDKVWKIPTRFVVYLVALAILLLATAFTKGLTIEGVPLIALNAVIVAVAAYGSYEITFAKLGQTK